MKRKLNTMLKKSVSALLLLAMLGLIANKIVFTHLHVAENGDVVSHAHPFSKSSDTSPIKSHHHSVSDYSFLDHLDILYLSICAVLSVLFIQFTNNNTTYSPDLNPYQFVSRESSRAPPTFAFI